MDKKRENQKIEVYLADNLIVFYDAFDYLIDWSVVFIEWLRIA